MSTPYEEVHAAPQVVARIPPSALLDLNRLATLREVSRCGSFTAAAESLCFTPSAISQQMTGLSRDLGFPLFDRTPHGMRLTAAGEVLAGHVSGVFARLNEAQGELEEVAEGARGRLRVGSFPTATVEFVAEAMGTFHDIFPQVSVSFADGEPYESIARLKERKLDLALVFDFDHWALSADFNGRLTCRDSEIECVDLFDDHCVVVLPHDHPLALRNDLDIGDLEGESILAGPAACSPWAADLRASCGQAGFEPTIDSHYRTLDFAALQAIVATGRGITLVPELALLPKHPGIVTLPLTNAPVRHVRIATLAGLPLTPGGIAMVELLQDAAAGRRSQTKTRPQLTVVG